MSAKCMMSLRRLACYGSVLNVIIIGVVFIWSNNCDNSDCLLSYAAVLDAVGGKVNCYDRSQNVPTQDEDEEGLRLYNCPTARFSDVPLQSTALASMPGSGNTWLRHLIQKATGIYTGSVYHDVALEKAGFLGESVTDSRVVVIKTHREMELLKYDRAILIIRDPYDAIVSEYNWRVCGNHFGRANSHVYNTTAWHQFVDKTADHWYRFYSMWLNEFYGPLHVVFYDDMKRNLATKLRSVLTFIDVPGTRVYCALRLDNGQFRRKLTNIVSRDLFTYAQRKTIDNYQVSVYWAIKQQQKRMRRRMRRRMRGYMRRHVLGKRTKKRHKTQARIMAT